MNVFPKAYRPRFLKRIPIEEGGPNKEGRYIVEYEFTEIGFKLTDCHITSATFISGRFDMANKNLKVTAWYQPIYLDLNKSTSKKP